ncbi:MAG: PPC domain-containing protein [Hyphomonadaceae bacterium]|jgi:hypothetical protein|nr:PPC domain-containing protein [Hyphomonadaceae bacterium]
MIKAGIQGTHGTAGMAPRLAWLATRVSCLALAAAIPVSGTAQAQTLERPAQIRPDRAVNATLAQGDAVLAADQSFYDVYRLPVTAGQRIRIRMTSRAFPPYLQVGHVLDEACETCEVAVADDAGNAELVYTASTSGNLDIRANSAAGGQTGAYTVRAEVVPPPTLAIQRIQPGQTVDSQLRESDITNTEGQTQRRYDVRLRAGTPVRVAVGGLGRIDPQVTVTGPSGTELGEDDDSGPGLDARLDFTPETSGMHQILVTGLQPGLTGPITVLVGPVPPPQPIVRADLVAGAPTSATLDETTALEDVDGDLVRVGRYQFPITEGKIYVVESNSGAFDSVIEVEQFDGNQVINTLSDDDSGGDLNARLRFRAETSGMARVAVRSLSGDGPYTIGYREYTPPPAPARGTPVEIGSSVAGKFDGTSPVRPIGEDGLDELPYIPYEVSLAEGQTVTVRVNRIAEDSPLDPYLLIGTGTPGNFVKLAEDDDSGSGLNARLHFTAPSAGTYLILASSFGQVAEADFRLEVQPYSAGAVAATPLVPGTAVNGQLLATSRITLSDDDGSPGQLFRLRAEAGSIHVIDARSGDFDTMLTLSNRADFGTELASDDDGGTGTNSRLAFRATEAGDYYILLTSFEGGDTTGAFTIEVKPGTEADLTALNDEVDVLVPVEGLEVDPPRPVLIPAPPPPPAPRRP